MLGAHEKGCSTQRVGTADGCAAKFHNAKRSHAFIAAHAVRSGLRQVVRVNEV
jgi:hypothetical protein